MKMVLPWFLAALALNATQDDSMNPLMHSVLQGRLDTFRSGSVSSTLPLADYQETDQKILYAWGMDLATANGIMEKTQDRIPSQEEIDQTVSYFSSKNLPFIWWTSANNLVANGFQFGGTLTGIALDISQAVPAKPQCLSDLQVKIVHSEDGLSAFTKLAANEFAMSPTATAQWLSLNRSVMEKEEQVHFMAFLNGKPVGTATLSIAPTSAGIWNLATLPEHRKHGVGAALVHATLVEAKKRQQTHVMAILMPKGLAWGLFTKLGFQKACDFPFYVYGVSSEDLEK